MDKSYNFLNRYSSDYICKDYLKITKKKLIIFQLILSKFLRKLFSKFKDKEVNTVRADYNIIWSNKNYFPKISSLKSKQILFYKNNYYEKDIWEERKIFFEVLKNQIVDSRPKSILEVGCGNGIIINSLARNFLDLNFNGIDLTETGIKVSQSLKNNKNYGDKIGNFFIKDYPKKNINNINFKNVSISEMTEDKKYDLCYSTLALEQMRSVQNEAIDKITKVTIQRIVLIEPFQYANKSLISKAYCKVKDYTSLKLKDLEINNFELKNTFLIPSKFHRQLAVVVLTKKLK